VSTSLQSLKTYIGCLSASEWSLRQRCWSGSVFAVSLQSTSGISAFPLHASKAASVCDLPLLELYWFHALRQPLGSGVLPSTDLYRLEQSATSTTFAGSVAEHLQAGTKDASILIRPATLSRFETLPLLINLPTYLLAYLLNIVGGHSNPKRAHPWVTTRHLSHKWLNSVQGFDLGGVGRKKV